MAIKIIISDTVGFKVKGSINDEKGIAQPFDFTLKCKRLNADEIKDKLQDQSEATLTDFMAEVVQGWAGVRDEDDKAMEFDTANFRTLCSIPGVAAIVFKTYMAEVGAKEKN
jgi:hypothetical protein